MNVSLTGWLAGLACLTIHWRARMTIDIGTAPISSDNMKAKSGRIVLQISDCMYAAGRLIAWG